VNVDVKLLDNTSWFPILLDYLESKVLDINFESRLGYGDLLFDVGILRSLRLRVSLWNICEA
jgi:hypothetical protein